MVFGEPMYFDGDSTDLQYLRVVTDQIMNKIQEMSGQEYIDIYAPKKSNPDEINVAGEED
jgi:1-acyl-sn-glycerol-3-phosphate acyltransferase